MGEQAERVLSSLDEAVWGMPTAALLLICGFFLMWKADFVPLRRFGTMMKTVFGGLFHKERTGDVSPFEALCTALAGTVGTGNITGVVVALCMGGPGAVFWMWVSALFGMGTKYSEIVLAVRFRERFHTGFVGGPMYVIKNGLGERYRWLAEAFSLFEALAAFGIGCMMQVGGVMTTLRSAADALFPGAGAGKGFCVIVGSVLAAATAATISGGAGGRGRMAARVVPVMALLYAIGAITVVAANFERVPEVLASIFSGAFSFHAAAGGTAGAALSWGLRRGMFSNEAGLGSSPIAHASAHAGSPAEQGCWGVFEVFADTVVMCTLTALLVLVSGVPLPSMEAAGAEICGAALAAVFGVRPAAVFLSVSMLLFAYTSIAGWSLYGERCAEFLCGEQVIIPYRAVFTAAVLLSSVLSFHLIIHISDILNALMILPNMISLILLSPVVQQETRKYFGDHMCNGKRI